MMKVQKHTGLVAITLTAPVDNYRRGRTHGFQPSHARKILQEGSGRKADVPASVDYMEVWDGISEEPSTEETRSRSQSAPAPSGNPDPGAVVIPDKWEERHHLANIDTAKKIVGDPAAVRTKADAERIIQDEVDRRKAAEA